MIQRAKFTVPIVTEDSTILNDGYKDYAVKWLTELEKDGQRLNSIVGVARVPKDRYPYDPSVAMGERKAFMLWADFIGTPREVKFDVRSEAQANLIMEKYPNAKLL